MQRRAGVWFFIGYPFPGRAGHGHLVGVKSALLGGCKCDAGALEAKVDASSIIFFALPIPGNGSKIRRSCVKPPFPTRQGEGRERHFGVLHTHTHTTDTASGCGATPPLLRRHADSPAHTRGGWQPMQAAASNCPRPHGDVCWCYLGCRADDLGHDRLNELDLLTLLVGVVRVGVPCTTTTANVQ